eukprot:TRINITY_DN19633_c0_g1_i1.p1 TRINITY_DN19633_c0_g1~~TRINITY_DN19633_c0_g1_i1.p1  ORF type:complete len:525 (-),score=118.97 TRINITY_DN19633_c0_g1_i1:57-1631(-)
MVAAPQAVTTPAATAEGSPSFGVEGIVPASIASVAVASAAPTGEAAPATGEAAGQAPLGTTDVVATLAAAMANQPPPKPKVLVLGDENLLFTSGLQEAYGDLEFTCASALSRQNLEVYNFDPAPQALKGRMRYMVDPCRIGKHFRQLEFDGLVLFLPGLSFAVPPELGTADRPLFAYRTHLFVFHVIRHAKLVLKPEAKLHLVWPEETGLMTSPCGAAGIEMQNLMTFCGLKPLEPEFQYQKIEEGWFMPFIFGEVPQETPQWLSNIQFLSFAIDKNPIPVPLSVALLLHPDLGFVSIKDPSTEPNPPPAPGSPLRACLIHEAIARKHRLKEIFGAKENADEATDAYGLVPEPAEEDSLLSIPMEIFMISFDAIPHISQIMKFQVIEDQPQVSVATLDMLDPRLPTRIARPPPPKGHAALHGFNMLGKKRLRFEEEEWGGMKFYCPLTKICTLTADKMRMHMSGELYKKMAASTPGWETSNEKKLLLEVLDEAEQSEQQQQRARKAINAANAAVAAAKGKGKGK